MDVMIFIVSGTLAAATALIFAAMGELVAEKSGVLNLGIEGMMAIGAAMGFVALTLSGSYTVGFVAAAVLGCLLSLVHAVLTLVFRADQTASGLAIGILGLGLSSAIGKSYEGRTVAGLPELDLGPLSDIPIVGQMFFQQDIMVYLSFVLVFATWYVLTRTKLGLVIRAIGESPENAHALGLKVRLIRAGCVGFGGGDGGYWRGLYVHRLHTALGRRYDCRTRLDRRRVDGVWHVDRAARGLWGVPVRIDVVVGIVDPSLRLEHP